MDADQPEQALELLNVDLKIRRKIHDRPGQGIALHSLGMFWGKRNKPLLAIDYLRQALDIMRESGNYALRNRQREAHALGNLGVAWLNLDDPRQAIDFLERQLKIAREIDDPMSEAHALSNSGLALDAIGDRDEAVQRMRGACAIFEAQGAEHPAERARAQLAKWGAADERS